MYLPIYYAVVLLQHFVLISTKVILQLLWLLALNFVAPNSAATSSTVATSYSPTHILLNQYQHLCTSNMSHDTTNLMCTSVLIGFDVIRVFFRLEVWLGFGVRGSVRVRGIFFPSHSSAFLWRCDSVICLRNYLIRQANRQDSFYCYYIVLRPRILTGILIVLSQRFRHFVMNTDYWLFDWLITILFFVYTCLLFYRLSYMRLDAAPWWLRSSSLHYFTTTCRL